MPPDQPKQDERNVFDWNGPIEVVLYTQDASEAELAYTWVLKLEGAGDIQIEFSDGDEIITRIVDNPDTDAGEPVQYREYVLQVDARTWPEGTHVLEVSLGEMMLPFYITVNSALENRKTPGEVIKGYQLGSV
jgi:hypothetical protein